MGIQNSNINSSPLVPDQIHIELRSVFLEGPAFPPSHSPDRPASAFSVILPLYRTTQVGASDQKRTKTARKPQLLQGE